MNKHLHRIIFNAARGLRMAVQETAKSCGKATGASSAAAVSFAALLALNVPLQFASPARAQVVVDPGAPASQRPTVLAAPNGVSVVNIQTPSAAGVSRNTYVQFDVPGQGTILNNSRINAQSQLGGWVQGNPWLATGSARVILNEVNSSNPSQLRGFVEVAGSRAEVIIANPSGVNIDGGGFINASRATITTGTSVMSGGNLEGFVVQKGLITVNGLGFDASQTDFTGLIARAVEVNGGIWAKDLRVVNGANQVSADQSVVVATAGLASRPVPSFALDVAQLGGMYAGKITLVGTEAGLGVRNAGALGSGGQLNITTDGLLQNSGQMSSAAEATLEARGGIINAAGGTIYSRGDATLRTTADVNNSGLIGAFGNTTLIANGPSSQISSSPAAVLAAGLQEDGTLATTGSAGNLDISATQGIAVHGQSLSSGAQRLSAASIDISRGQNSAQSLSLTAHAGDIDASGAVVAAVQGLSISTSGLLNTSAANVSANELSIGARDFSNTAGHVLQIGSGDTSIAATGAIANTGGRIASNGNVRIAAQSIANQGGTVEAGGGAHLTVASAAALDNSAGGRLMAGGDAQLTVGSLDNNQGEIKAAGTLSAVANQAMINTRGLIAANGAVALAAVSLDNARGTVSSVRNSVSIASTGSTTNDSGRIEAGGSVNLENAGLSNTQAIGAAQSGSITGLNINIDTHGQAFNNARGTVAAGQDITLNTGTLNNSAGLIQVAGALLIDTHGQALNNSGAATHASGLGGIVAQGTAILRTAELSNSGGFIGAQGALAISGAHISNAASGQIVGGSTIAATGSSFDNQSAQVQALGMVSVNTGTGSINNSAGLIRSASSVTLAAGAVTNRDTGAAGQGIESNNVTITASTIENNNGAMRADGDFTLTSSAIDNSSGLISAGNRLTLQGTTGALAIVNTAGTLIADQRTTIAAASLTGDGRVLSKGDLSVTLTSDFHNSGEVTANNNAGISTAGNLSNSGQIRAGNSLTLSARNISNSATGAIAAAATQVTASSTLTNRGLIDGQDTQISATTLTNLGTGRIYGDRLSIRAGIINNDAEGASAGTLAARQRLDIGAGTLNNREHALIFSAGDTAIAGGLDASREATGRADSINNASATIEALGDLRVDAAQISNTNNHFSTQVMPVSSTGVTEYQIVGSDNRWAPSEITLTLEEELVLNTPEGSSHWVGFNRYDYSRNVSESQVASSDPAQIISGGSMTLNADAVLNDKSRIMAGGALTGTVGSLTNTEVAGERVTTDTGSVTNHFRIYRSGTDTWGTSTAGYAPAPAVQTISLAPSVYQAFVAPAGTGTLLANTVLGSVSAAISAAGTVSASARTGTIIQVSSSVDVGGSIVRTVQANVALPNASLFTVNSSPTGNFLIETDPRFTNYRQWLSSDYMLAALNLDPSLTQKRLGDGFYEQRLIQEQVAQLTGKRFLANYQSSEAQFQALMAAGVTFAQQHDLVPGIALSPSQMAQLTSDIVWLVERDVTLPDGRVTKALVPQVYVRIVDGDLTGGGALISAGAVNLNVSNDLTNSGTIAGRRVVALNAQNVQNLGGRIRGADVSVAAAQDLNNIGGTIKAETSLIAIAGRDLNAVSTTATQRGSTGATTNIDRVAGLYGSNPGGTLMVAAGRDINLTAAQLQNNTPALVGQAAGSTSLVAGRNLKLDTVTEASSNKVSWDAANQRQQSQAQEVGSVIEGAGSVRLVAGADVNARAASVAAGGTLTVAAGNDVNITAGQSNHSVQESHRHTSKGLFSKKTTTQHQTLERSNVIASSLAGDSMAISAGVDLNVQASNLAASNALTLAAGRDIDITESHDVLATSAFTETRKTSTGLGKVVGAALVTTTMPGAVTAGASMLTKSNGQQQAQNTSSTVVGSALSAGSITVLSGRDATVRGSTLVADGDIAVAAARDLSIVSASTTETASTHTFSKKTGMIGTTLQPAIGTLQKSQEETAKSTRQVESTVASLVGNVTIQAGQNYTQTASQVLALGQPGPGAIVAGGDIDIEAGSVLINEAYNSGNILAKQQTRQKSIGGSASIPVVDAVKGMASVTKSSAQTSDPRMQALAAATLAMQAKPAADAVASAAAGSAGGIKVSVSISSSKSQSTSEQSYREAEGSTVSAGGSATITATGQASQGAGNVVIAGSNITAGRDVNINASGQLDILAAKSTSEQHSTNSSSGASVGIGFAIGGAQNGFTLELAANKARGNADGSDVSYTNSHITGGGSAGDRVALQSGGDTNLKGAVVAGNAVVAGVGGNLNIESLQDSAQFDAKQSSSGAGLSLCVPPFCYGASTGSVSAGKSKVNSDYASVVEQSGIKAGDGGFQVDVQGDTDLKGAVIASTDKAVLAGSNSFQTGGNLTTSDIKNRAVYKGEAYQIAASVSGKLGDQSTAATTADQAAANAASKPGGSAGVGRDKGEARSTTTSGISDIAGNTAVRSADPPTGIGKIFDSGKVQREIDAQVTITAHFGQQAVPAAAKFADDKAIELRRQRNEEEALKWDEGGIYRIAMYGGLGILTGGAGGAAGAVGSALIVPSIGEEIASLNLPEAARQGLTQLMGLSIGIAIGGVAGGATALSQTTFNYVSHSPFASVRATVSRENARLLNECGAGCTLADLRNIDIQMQKLEAAGNLSAIAERSELTTEQARQLTQTVLELMPVFGSAESVAQLVTGKQSLTSDEADRFWAAVGVVPIAGAMLQRVGRTTADVVNAMVAADKVVDVTKKQGLINDANRLFKQYVDDIETQTGYRLYQAQRSALAKEMATGNHAITLSPAENRALRAQFDAQRPRLIAAWETHTGQPWPKVETVGVDGNIILRPADAHHVIPVTNNGPTQWWNITPAVSANHRALHSPTGPLRQLQLGAQ